jgi:hypothetical protein
MQSTTSIAEYVCRTPSLPRVCVVIALSFSLSLPRSLSLSLSIYLKHAHSRTHTHTHTHTDAHSLYQVGCACEREGARESV